ncbi:hypothetical protein [Gimesia aquarii]|uniref:Uncharacterized protein n=1 Tax=Gimesia aquarii TaxID=2527964 RepID=A0A517WWS4_9PLAN|nr:hypothetical protein [Gimesia aquarii]QDU09652.1 hypothetical protein V202x_30280 [Gimesia aquarii]
MKRKKNKTITIVSMSFLDLLSCALGAVLLLDIMFSRAIRPGHSTEKIPFAAVTVRQFITVKDTLNRDELHKMIQKQPNKYLQNSLTLSDGTGITELITSDYGRDERYRTCYASWANPRVTTDDTDSRKINIEWTVVLTFLKSTNGCVTLGQYTDFSSSDFQKDDPGHVYWYKMKSALELEKDSDESSVTKGCFELEELEDNT